MGKAKAKTEFQPQNVVKRLREVPDPHMTDAEFRHQLRKRPDEPAKVGKVVVIENAMSRIGALCYLKPTKPQEEAAELFKAMYESLYGAQPAMDMSNPVVDRSPVAHDSGMANRVDRADKMRLALKVLGRNRFNCIVATVCMGISFKNQGYENWRQRKRQVQSFLDSLDELAEVWELKSRSAA